MIAKYDYYGEFESPTLTLCNPDDKEVGMIDNYKNFKLSPEFNNTWELQLDVYKHIKTDNDKLIDLPVYKLIENRRQILVQDLGYFTIVETNENITENGEDYKSITALSCEIELSNIDLRYFNGTYKFYDDSPTVKQETLLFQIFSNIPHWNIGHVDSTIANRYRTFDEPDTNVYNFLLTDVQSSYDCIFEFDRLTRTVDVYDKNNYVYQTDIILGVDDVLNNIDIRASTDNIFTVLRVEGDNGLTINGANPLGTDSIYNFSHFKNLQWMDQSLIDAMTLWENKLAQAEITFSATMTQLVEKNSELEVLKTDYNHLKINLKNYRLQRDAMISEGVSNLNSINSQIASTINQMNSKRVKVNAKQAEVNAIDDNVRAIYDDVKLEVNFTNSQLKTLARLMFPATYKDDNITITDSMTYAEINTQEKELYNMGKTVLNRLSNPTLEFSVDSKSFIFNKAFAKYTEQLELGHLIDLRLSETEVGSFILLKMDIDYENKTIDLTFGNRFRLMDAEALFANDASRVAKSTVAVNYKKNIWDDAFVKSKEAYDHTKLPLDLTKNAILSADGQTVEINDGGYHGRRVDPVTGEVSPKEIIITSNRICFTDDGWQTANSAFGEIILPDGTTVYGLVGQAIIGNIFVGNKLRIENDNGTFRIDENGLYSKFHNDAIDGLDTRLNSAEQKITPEAIIQTVTDSPKFTQVISEVTKGFFRIVVSSSTGLTFTDSNTDIKLTCNVFNSQGDITHTIDPRFFLWQRKSTLVNSDKIWNSFYKTSSEITLTSNDVVRSSTFSCDVTLPDYDYLISDDGSYLLTNSNEQIIVLI